MPYIKPTRRELFDNEIEALQTKLLENRAEEGDYNYVITRIIMTIVAKEIRYNLIVKMTGVLKNVSSEIYRRIASTYENMTMTKNTDIPEFEKVQNAMLNKFEK